MSSAAADVKRQHYATCKTWSHYRCQDIDRTDRDQWRHNVKLPYICIRCRTNDDDSYDYLMGMERIRKASDGGLPKLQKAAEREKLFLKRVPCETTLHSEFNSNEQDQIANTLITHFHATDKVALQSTPDGDCFFNSISTLLVGDESRSTELRYRCCIEMTLNKSKLMLHSQYKRITVLCPPLEKDCINCARPGTNSSMHMFMATSRFLNLPIKVLYPAVNGTNTYNFKVMNTLLRPPFADPEKGTINIMWTSLRLPMKQPTSSDPWNPNHIVPMVGNVTRGPVHTMAEFRSSKETIPEPVYLNTENRYGILIDESTHQDQGEKPKKITIKRGAPKGKSKKITNKRGASTGIATSTPTKENTDVGNHPVRDEAHVAPTKIELSTPKKENTDVGNHPVRDEALGAPTVEISFDASSINLSAIAEESNEINSEELDGSIQSETEYAPGPLGNKFMDIKETLKALSEPETILDGIPAGRKDGRYFTIQNRNNTERRAKGKKSEFWDDCGSWSNGASPTFTFVTQNGKLMTIVCRSGVYCTEKMKEKKKVYEPLQPQPPADEVLVIKRLYNTLSASEKGPSQFKRRITWVVNSPVSMPELLLEVALVEYIGNFPDRRPHGKAITNNNPYIRTKPSVARDLKEQLKSQTVKEVKTCMNRKTSNDHEKQRNEKQLRNMKYQQNRIADNIPSNAADQIVYVEEMVKTHEFVYSVKHINGLHHPVITLFTTQQIADLKRFCGTGNTVLGIDKTYNLGDFHVTPTIFKDLSVIRQSTKQHPITFGPTFLHTNSSARTYSSFFHDIADNLTTEEIEHLVVGSDEEKAFQVAIQRCLPGATHTLCTRHLRQNTEHYLKDQVGYPKSDRQHITQAIYGEDGIAFACDMDSFNYKLERLKEKIQAVDKTVGGKKFMPYFQDKLLPMYTKFVKGPTDAGKIDRGWTNNNCESANHILKAATQWRQTDIPKFIQLLYDIITGETIERCRAIRGMGDYELDPKFVHNRVDIDKWSNMSQESRDNRERKFLSDKGRTTQNIIISQNGHRAVLKTPNAGKKPQQLKRKRAERSRTPSAKRVLLA